MMEHAARRREQLMRTVAELDGQVTELDVLVRRQAEGREDARRLMTHPGVGPQTALGMVLTLGEAGRFAGTRQVASYLGLTPREHSSGGKRQLGTHEQAGIVVDAVSAGRRPGSRR